MQVQGKQNINFITNHNTSHYSSYRWQHTHAIDVVLRLTRSSVLLTFFPSPTVKVQTVKVNVLEDNSICKHVDLSSQSIKRSGFRYLRLLTGCNIINIDNVTLMKGKIVMICCYSVNEATLWC